MQEIIEEIADFAVSVVNWKIEEFPTIPGDVSYAFPSDFDDRFEVDATINFSYSIYEHHGYYSYNVDLYEFRLDGLILKGEDGSNISLPQTLVKELQFNILDKITPIINSIH